MTETVKNEKPKRRVNSKAKGGAFESKISKILTSNFQPMKFAKTPQSGGRVGGQNFGLFGKFFSKDALNLFVGDVVPVNEADCEQDFRFVIECKAYKDSEKMEHLLYGNSNIYGWMEEVLVDCVKVKKDGIVIFKWNNTPIYTAVTEKIVLPDGIKKITLTNGIQITYLNDLLTYKEFWLTTRNKE